MAQAPKIEAVTITPNPVDTGGSVIIRVKVTIPIWDRLKAFTWDALRSFTWRQLYDNKGP